MIDGESMLGQIYDLADLFEDNENKIVGSAGRGSTKAPKPDELGSLSEKVGEQVSSRIREVWSQLNGLKIEFYPQEGVLSWYYGQCKIPSAKNLGESTTREYHNGEWVTVPFWDSDDVSYFLLDTPGRNVFILFSWEEGKERIWLQQFDEAPKELSLDFEGYIENALKFAGAWLWQTRFLKDSEPFSQRYSLDCLSVSGKSSIPDFLKSYLPESANSGVKSPLSDIIENGLKANFYTLLNDRKSKMESNGAKFSEFRNLDQITTGATPAAFRKAEHYLKRFLTTELYELYMFLNGFEMRWEHPDSRMKGAARVLPVEEMIGGPNGVGKRVWDDTAFKDWLWFDDTEDSVKEFVKPLKVFFEFEGESREIVIDFRPETPECFILSKFERSGRTASPKEVIDMLFDSMGRQGWEQYVFGEGFPDGEREAFVQEVRALWE